MNPGFSFDRMATKGHAVRDFLNDFWASLNLAYAGPYAALGARRTIPFSVHYLPVD
jgi:hypothetical protein